MYNWSIISQILKEVEKKDILNTQRIKDSDTADVFRKYIKSDIFFDEISSEIQEVKDENKQNNSVYLEDELWDIFWDYINLLYFLEKENKISLERVFERCLRKYSNRISALENWVLWEDIKKQQKESLAKEHKQKYEL